MTLVTESHDALPAALQLVMAKNVRNYLILAGDGSSDAEEKLGCCGADIMLYAQTLGLNSWWIGGTFSRKNVGRRVPGGMKVSGILALGYRATQGVPHKSKEPGEISSYDGGRPEWFAKGVEALLFAPTALNKQAFTVKGREDKVSLICRNGIFSAADRGIGKYHF